MTTLDLIAVALASGIAIEPLLLKPLNVSRIYDYEDLTLNMFQITALYSVNVFRKCIRDSKKGKFTVGKRIRELVLRTYKLTRQNTCLGTAILLIPLAYSIGDLYTRLETFKEIDIEIICLNASRIVKKYSTPLDTVHLYNTIRKIKPRHVFQCREYYTQKEHFKAPDVSSPNYVEHILKEKITLWEVFSESSRIDMVSAQIVDCYIDVLKICRIMQDSSVDYSTLSIRILRYLLNRYIDTMLLRKFGKEIAYTICSALGKILEKLQRLDEENVKFINNAFRRINLGTYADIIACSISLTFLKHILENKDISKLLSAR